MSRVYLLGSESSSECGYCKKPSTEGDPPLRTTFYMHAFALLPAHYQHLMDRYLQANLELISMR